MCRFDRKEENFLKVFAVNALLTLEDKERKKKTKTQKNPQKNLGEQQICYYDFPT